MSTAQKKLSDSAETLKKFSEKFLRVAQTNDQNANVAQSIGQEKALWGQIKKDLLENQLVVLPAEVQVAARLKISDIDGFWQTSEISSLQPHVQRGAASMVGQSMQSLVDLVQWKAAEAKEPSLPVPVDPQAIAKSIEAGAETLAMGAASSARFAGWLVVVGALAICSAAAVPILWDVPIDELVGWQIAVGLIARLLTVGVLGGAGYYALREAREYHRSSAAAHELYSQLKILSVADLVGSGNKASGAALVELLKMTMPGSRTMPASPPDQNGIFLSSDSLAAISGLLQSYFNKK